VTVLVTGSSGHLGEALVRTLQAQGRETIGIDILPGAFTQRVGSITDRAFVRGCMKGVTRRAARRDAAQAACGDP
jgi:nucleoside-diphosphate-sugar epimerase